MNPHDKWCVQVYVLVEMFTFPWSDPKIACTISIDNANTVPQKALDFGPGLGVKPGLWAQSSHSLFL